MKEQYRPRLSKTEMDIIEQYREKHKFLAKECDEKGVPLERVSSYWLKSKHISINVRGNKDKDYFDLRDQIINDMAGYAPRYPVIDRAPITDGHLLVIDPADVHIGKLALAMETGDEYNVAIAIERVKQGVVGLIKKASGFPIDQILLVIGNDMLHVDNASNTTTRGTKQDMDGMWYNNFLIAKQLYIEVIEMLCTVADVHVQYDPSNHDYTNGFFLADSIASWFRNCTQTTFNIGISHRKYFTYGKNLILTTHGDGAKGINLALLMAHEAPQQWAACPHRYGYTHHYHHKEAKDHMGVCIESLRSPSGADSYHHKEGYQHAPKAIEGFVHHPVHGQVARLTHIF